MGEGVFAPLSGDPWSVELLSHKTPRIGPFNKADAVSAGVRGGDARRRRRNELKALSISRLNPLDPGRPRGRVSRDQVAQRITVLGLVQPPAGNNCRSL